MDKILRSAVPPWLLIAAGFIWGGITDALRNWILDKIMHVAFVGPALLIAVGIAWLYYLTQPRFEIFCEPSHHPFRQEWDDSGGHEILFRVGVRNKSKRRAINRAEVKLTTIDPFDIHCIPARLLLMNESESAREFFLPPEGVQYVDVLQQSQPSGDLILWHTVQSQPKTITPRNYTLTITAFGDNAPSLSKQFQITKEATVYSLKELTI